MIRRECVADIGLLDTSFFMYAEDIEWCYRAKDPAGRYIMFPPQPCFTTKEKHLQV